MSDRYFYYRETTRRSVIRLERPIEETDLDQDRFVQGTIKDYEEFIDRTHPGLRYSYKQMEQDDQPETPTLKQKCECRWDAFGAWIPCPRHFDGEVTVNEEAWVETEILTPEEKTITITKDQNRLSRWRTDAEKTAWAKANPNPFGHRFNNYKHLGYKAAGGPHE